MRTQVMITLDPPGSGGHSAHRWRRPGPDNLGGRRDGWPTGGMPGPKAEWPARKRNGWPAGGMAGPRAGWLARGRDGWPAGGMAGPQVEWLPGGGHDGGFRSRRVPDPGGKDQGLAGRGPARSPDG